MRRDSRRTTRASKSFRKLLFAKIVPAIKRIGLLSDRQRERFHKLGILQYEDWADPVRRARASGGGSRNKSAPRPQPK